MKYNNGITQSEFQQQACIQARGDTIIEHYIIDIHT